MDTIISTFFSLFGTLVLSWILYYSSNKKEARKALVNVFFLCLEVILLLCLVAYCVAFHFSDKPISRSSIVSLVICGTGISFYISLRTFLHAKKTEEKIELKNLREATEKLKAENVRLKKEYVLLKENKELWEEKLNALKGEKRTSLLTRFFKKE